jgi:hypothetical protein
MEDVLGQAQSVATSLGEQRRIFDSAGLKLENVTSRFPMVSGLLNAIRRKKSKVRCSLGARSDVRLNVLCRLLVPKSVVNVVAMLCV